MVSRRSEYIAVAIVLGVLFGLATQAAAAPRIVMNAYSEVAGEKIYLSEVAVISGLTPERIKTLGQLSLGPSPRPDEETTLSRRQIETRLYQAGLESGEYELAIPEKVTFKRKAVRVSGKSLTDFAVDFLQNNIIWAGGPVKVKVKNLPPDIVLAYGEVSMTGILDTKPDQAAARNFRIDVFLNGVKVRGQSMSSFVEVYGDVLVAADTIPAGAIISEADVELKEMPLGKLRSGALVSSDDVVGKKIRRAASKDTVIYRSMLDMQPDIKAGALVSILIGGEGFQITAKGKALEKGFKGDIIKVAPIDSKKVLQGVIIDSQNVEIISSK